MKYIDEFRNEDLAGRLSRSINSIVDKKRTYNIMEVCGTHTMNIFRFGIRTLLPKNINLISGPGCPVCITPIEYIDKIMAYSRMRGIIITTFGDMLRVPGSNQNNLYKEKANGADIRMVYSASDSLNIAMENKNKKVVFLGIGFETTIPTVAATILESRKKKVRNHFVLSMHKVMPPALKSLSRDKRINVDGFMLPGHVSAIIGARPYAFLAKKYRKACAIAGFEPLDILRSVYLLVDQINRKSPKVDIEYSRVVRPNGNGTALHLMEKVFDRRDSVWRGLGRIESSGLVLKRRFRDFDIESVVGIRVVSCEPKNCLCAYIIKGIKTPPDCRLFGKVCTPENPIGACMVSNEGTCSAYYKYRS